MTNQTTPPLRALRPFAGRFWRGVLFRLAAVGLGLSPLMACEAALWLCGVGRPAELDDPLVTFAQVQPLFVQDESGQRWEISPQRYEYFRPASFPTRKDPREKRIFCLGGSTVQGNPYTVETSFTTWLELSLTAADSRHLWRVVNCGGVSYASYRLVPILQEVLTHQPDLVILYTGHNEFLEARTYRHLNQLPPIVENARNGLARLRTFWLLRSWWVTAAGPRPSPSRDERARLPAEVDALLDYQGGLADYRRDDSWRNGVITHYEWSVRRMVQLCQNAGVPVLLVNPVSNLKDTPPFKWEHRRGISAADREKFQTFWDQARDQDSHVAAASTRLAEEARLLEAALALDDRHAGVWFHLGQCRYAQRDLRAAKEAFVRAKEEDICPLRMLEPMHLALRRIAEETSVPLVDVRRLFEQHSEDGIPGNELLADHVHPTIHGHQLIAAELLKILAAEGHAQLEPGSDEIRKRLYREHLESLDVTYYARGEERLEGLRRWSQGRALKVRKGAGPQQIERTD